MGALDRIKAQGAAGGGVVEVPEWGDETGPLQVHFRRIMLRDVSEAARAAPDDPVRQNLEVFVRIARDAAGQPLFRLIDALELMDVADPAVMGRVLREMGVIRPAAETTVKN